MPCTECEGVKVCTHLNFLFPLFRLISAAFNGCHTVSVFKESVHRNLYLYDSQNLVIACFNGLFVHLNGKNTLRCISTTYWSGVLSRGVSVAKFKQNAIPFWSSFRPANSFLLLSYSGLLVCWFVDVALYF